MEQADSDHIVQENDIFVKKSKRAELNFAFNKKKSLNI